MSDYKQEAEWRLTDAEIERIISGLPRQPMEMQFYPLIARAIEREIIARYYLRDSGCHIPGKTPTVTTRVTPNNDYMQEAERLVDEYGAACCVHFRVLALEPGNTSHREDKNAARTALLAHIERGPARVPEGWKLVPMPEIRKLLRECNAPDSAFYTVWKDGIDVDIPAPWIEQALQKYGDAREAAGYARGLVAAMRGEVK
jgi:hypothetical protein